MASIRGLLAHKPVVSVATGAATAPPPVDNGPDVGTWIFLAAVGVGGFLWWRHRKNDERPGLPRRPSPVQYVARVVPEAPKGTKPRGRPLPPASVPSARVPPTRVSGAPSTRSSSSLPETRRADHETSTRRIDHEASTRRASSREVNDALHGGAVISRRDYSYPDVPRFTENAFTSFRWRPPVDAPAPSTMPMDEGPLTQISAPPSFSGSSIP